MGAPKLVRELVCGGRRGGGRGGIVEMVGEHGSPFPRPASQAVGFRQSNAVPSKEGLRRSWFWGSIRTARLLISPRLPGTPARPHSAGLCVSGASFLRLCGANHLRHLASVGSLPSRVKFSRPAVSTRAGERAGRRMSWAAAVQAAQGARLETARRRERPGVPSPCP